MFKKKHILVIDDDERLRNLLTSFLFEKGYLVDSSKNTHSAKIKMSNILYDLIILDVMLPNESGISFAEKNRNNINISSAIEKKMIKNRKKYPTEKFKGHF